MQVDGLSEALFSMVGADLPPIGEKDYTDENDGLIHCGKCHEAKQTVIHVELPGWENRMVRRACSCDRKIQAEEDRRRKAREDMEKVTRLRNLSLMDEKVRDSTFSTFQTTQENARALKLCRRYVEAFDTMIEKNQGLLFWGNPGTGKTFAAACIANYLLDNMRPVVMTSFVKLISELQKQRGDEDEETIISRLNQASLLIIDDLGAERSTDYALEKVYNVIDSRYRVKKPMLLTTNLSLKEMQSTTDIRYARIYDRVFEVCYPVEFKGQSWRFAEAARRYDEMQELLEG